jgi:hypothetical protein
MSFTHPISKDEITVKNESKISRIFALRTLSRNK